MSGFTGGSEAGVSRTNTHPHHQFRSIVQKMNRRPKSIVQRKYWATCSSLWNANAGCSFTMRDVRDMLHAMSMSAT
eukprot:1504158-Amphidinium_carterae.2